MNTKDLKPRWALSIVAGIIPIIGAISAVIYHDISMFLWSLAIAAVAAVILPLILLIVFVVSSYAGAALAGVFISIQRLFTRK